MSGRVLLSRAWHVAFATKMEGIVHCNGAYSMQNNEPSPILPETDWQIPHNCQFDLKHELTTWGSIAGLYPAWCYFTWLFYLTPTVMCSPSLIAFFWKWSLDTRHCRLGSISRLLFAWLGRSWKLWRRPWWVLLCWVPQAPLSWPLQDLQGLWAKPLPACAAQRQATLAARAVLVWPALQLWPAWQVRDGGWWEVVGRWGGCGRCFSMISSLNTEVINKSRLDLLKMHGKLQGV